MGGVTHLPAAGVSPKEGRVENQREAEREENIFPIWSRYSFTPTLLPQTEPSPNPSSTNPPPPHCDREAVDRCCVHLQEPTARKGISLLSSIYSTGFTSYFQPNHSVFTFLTLICGFKICWVFSAFFFEDLAWFPLLVSRGKCDNIVCACSEFSRVTFS